MTEVWRSPRKIEEEIKEYRRKRFESLMEEVDSGLITNEEALGKMATELVVSEWVEQGE